MARLDIQSALALKRVVYSFAKEASFHYHALAQAYSQLVTEESKVNLAKTDPFLAAELFYHFDDRFLAGEIVSFYSGNKISNLRTLALSVKDVLNIRKENSQALEHILGMSSVPIFSQDVDRDSTNGLFDNVERAYEETFG